MRRPLALLLVLLAPALARAGETVPVEETETYETRGELAPGETRAHRFLVVREDATRVSFHLLRGGAPDALLRLDARGPDGTPAGEPVESRGDFLALDARPARAAGEWRVTLALDPSAPEPVAFVLVVLVAHERPVTLHEVSLREPAALPHALGWTLVVAAALACAALGLALRNARPRVPRGGQHAVPDAGTAGVCAAPVTERR